MDDAGVLRIASRMTQLQELLVFECEHITPAGEEAAEAAVNAPDRENNLLVLYFYQ